MECKGNAIQAALARGKITVEPKWNVKLIAESPLTTPPSITVEPKWNVKLFMRVQAISCTDYSRTKVECKVFSTSPFSIYPRYYSRTKVECKVRYEV